jgi:hypothetical protein
LILTLNVEVLDGEKAGDARTLSHVIESMSLAVLSLLSVGLPLVFTHSL